MIYDGSERNKPQAIVDGFADYFSKSFTPNNGQRIYSSLNLIRNTLYIKSVSQSEVLIAIKDPKNQCISQSIEDFSDLPVYKKGNKTDLKNPVSHISIFAKIFETLLHVPLYRHTMQALSQYQHAFMKGRSTETNLVSITQTLCGAIDTCQQRRMRQVRRVFPRCTLQEVKDWLQHESDINSYDESGNTILATAAYFGQIDTVNYLCEMGANIDSFQYPEGQPPLSQAISHAHRSIVKILLEKNASVNVVDCNGYSPLIHAILKGNSTIASMLINAGADINSCFDFGYTPLAIAAEKNRLDIIEILLENNVDVTIFSNNEEVMSMQSIQMGTPP
ncbi:ankyrin repeat and protein kinase domain-containing protein 1-like [Zophobas morio]|uniref:ankyrin repeat and protein kinase domain-containing protein 1-like n=1 Tax=Zophobas morio TaxID=2755281 RepID=UPI0030837D0E